MCDLHALRDNVEFQKWGQQYADANIEVFDEYVTCADGVITVCKDVCEVNISVILYDRSGYSVNRHFR